MVPKNNDFLYKLWVNNFKTQEKQKTGDKRSIQLCQMVPYKPYNEI